MSTLAIHGGDPAVPQGMIKPWPWVTDDDRRSVMEALENVSPWTYPTPCVRKLEQEWARFTGTRHCLAANSGTASLHMAVAAAGIGPGDEVLVPAFTFLASASCVMHSNGIPIFVDIDPRTCTIDPGKLEERITNRTRAIVAVDIHGIPASYDEIRAVAERRGLRVIEDGSQAHGATYKGRPVGSLGDLAGVSLNASKNLPSASEGGLFTTDDDRCAELAERIRIFGEEVKPGERRQYNAYMMGWNYRFDELQAAFVLSQLRRLPAMTLHRRRNAERLSFRLRGMTGIETPAVPPDRTHSYFFYVLRVKPGRMGIDLPAKAVRDALEKALKAEGMPVQRWQTVTVPGQTLFQYRDGYGKGCPWSCSHAREGIVYRPEEYPESQSLIDEFLALGHCMGGLGPPNDQALMDRYADAVEKVMVGHRREFLDFLEREIQA